MRCYTVIYDPDIDDIKVSPGFLVSRKDDQLLIELGLAGRNSNIADLLLYKGNIPVLISKDEDTYVHNAKPLIHTGNTGLPRVFLECANEDDRGYLVRFNLGAAVPSSSRGTVWPDEGSPALYGYATIGEGTTCPIWYSDSVWSISTRDRISVLVKNRTISFTIKDLQ